MCSDCFYKQKNECGIFDFQENVPTCLASVACFFHISVMQTTNPVLTATAKMIAVMPEAMLAIVAGSELCCAMIHVPCRLNNFLCIEELHVCDNDYFSLLIVNKNILCEKVDGVLESKVHVVV